MNLHFADRFTLACRARRTALCVGLDPRWDQLPQAWRKRFALPGGGGDRREGTIHANITLEDVAQAFQGFCLRVLEIVAPHVALVKPQSAFFEACGPAGMSALQAVLKRARELGLLTILDSKRNDIASTASAYADAAFAGTAVEGRVQPVWQADAITINPYLGRDAVEPFLASARCTQGGVFVLVRTSNKGASQFQDLDCGGQPLYKHVARAVGAWSQENVGACGLGDVGAVVGATHPAELAQVRLLLPHVIFLVPGFGAQGGNAKDAAAAFRPDGTGAIVNSSRGITAAFDPDEKDWEGAIDAATRAAIAALRADTPMANLHA